MTKSFGVFLLVLLCTGGSGATPDGADHRSGAAGTPSH